MGDVMMMLTSDFPGTHLPAGDVGTVIHAHSESAAYEVEFSTLTGETVAVVTVLSSQCRPVAAIVPIVDFADRSRQRPLLPLKGTGSGLSGEDSRRTLRELRDEWNR